MLSKVLKGSGAKDVLAHGLDQIPVHGAWRHLAPDEIMSRIDWTIRAGYLDYEYAGRIPVLVFTRLGWYIERETFANETVAGFDSLLANPQRPYDMTYLKDRNRQMILLILEKIRDSGDRKYLPVLEDRQLIDYRKVREAIRDVIAHLAGTEMVAQHEG